MRKIHKPFSMSTFKEKRSTACIYYVYECMHAMAHIWMSENNLQYLVLLVLVPCGFQIQVIRLVCQ